MTDKKQRKTRKAGPGRPVGSKNSSIRGQAIDMSLTELDRVDHAMLRFEQGEPTVSNKAIQEKLGIPERQVSKRRKRDIYQQALIELHKTHTQVLRDGKIRAARRLVALIDDSSPSIALAASKALLQSDLARTINLHLQGGKLEEKIDTMSVDELEEFIKTGTLGLPDGKLNND